MSFVGGKTGISLNYYYREGETCILCAPLSPLPLPKKKTNNGECFLFLSEGLKIAHPGSKTIAFSVVPAVYLLHTT